MQILLVDDEPYAVDDLALSMDWERLGITEVYKAYSAYEALEQLKRTPIDIVLTDITMPGMSGIELAGVIRRSWKQTKVLLLSGYAEFDYAKQALAYGVTDYLTKPIGDDELVRKLESVIRTIREEWRDIASYERAVSVFEEHLPLLRNNLLRDLLQGRRMADDRLETQLVKFQLPFSLQDSVVLMTIRLEADFHHFTTDDMFLFEYAIDNMAHELFGSDHALWSCKDEFGHLIYAVKAIGDSLDGESAYGRISLLAEDLQRNVEVYLRGGISVVLSREGRLPHQLPELYQAAISSLRRHIGSGQGYFLTLDGGEEPHAIAALAQLYDPPSFVQLFESGRWQAVRDKLADVFDEMAQKRIDTEEHLREIYGHLLTAGYYIVHKNGKLLIDVAGAELTDQLPFRSAAALQEWADALIGRIENEFETEMMDTRKNLVRMVHEYIDAYLDSATAQSIAQHVALHPVYLSKVYKQETSQSIGDTIYRKRMEKATHLLRNTKLKIYEITTMLGYSNAHYFIKLFKEYAGLTPQEYRDRAQGESAAPS